MSMRAVDTNVLVRLLVARRREASRGGRSLRRKRRLGLAARSGRSDLGPERRLRSPRRAKSRRQSTCCSITKASRCKTPTAVASALELYLASKPVRFGFSDCLILEGCQARPDTCRSEPSTVTLASWTALEGSSQYPRFLSSSCIQKCSCVGLHTPALHCIRLRWRGCADAVRFYGSCQGVCETPRIEFGLVGVDRPGGASDAPSEDDEGRGAG